MFCVVKAIAASTNNGSGRGRPSSESPTYTELHPRRSRSCAIATSERIVDAAAAVPPVTTFRVGRMTPNCNGGLELGGGDIGAYQMRLCHPNIL